jgi:prepilin-type N-terminal cleavage/methylation domain-containing protein
MRNTRSHSTLRPQAGFTLVELFFVVVVIGALAALGIAKYRGVKEKGYKATMLSDLRHLSTSEENHFNETGVYTVDLATLKQSPSRGVTIAITSADANGWAARATHAASALTCAVFHGSAEPEPPATAAGLARCE